MPAALSIPAGPVDVLDIEIDGLGYELRRADGAWRLTTDGGDAVGAGYVGRSCLRWSVALLRAVDMIEHAEGRLL